jgi:hypothetical protein
MIPRRRFKHTASLKERLSQEAASCREQAKLLPPGAVREALLRKARQADTAAHIDNWLRSPGLQPPQEVATLMGKDE